MNSKLMLFVAVPLVFAGGCHNKGSTGKKNAASSGAPASEAAAGTPAKPSKAATPSAASASGTPWKVDAAAAQAKLQGVWVVKNVSSLGDVQAWNVKGDQVTVFDGTKQYTAKLAFDAPCELRIVMSAGGGSLSQTVHYAWDGNELHVGLGDSGVKQGDAVIACVSNGVYVSKGFGCELYTNDFGDWKARPATCTLKGGAFHASAGTSEKGTLKVHGAVLASDQLWTNVATKASDYAAAKKQVAAARKK